MMVGLPASGKSTYAKKLADKENAIILASDELRKELFGDVNDTKHNNELFQELHKRAIQYLKEGKNVIYDATNINSKRRATFLKQLPINVKKECYYMNTSLDVITENNSNRERKVPMDVIKRMRKMLQIPMYYEGWDKINIVDRFSKYDYFDDIKFLENLIYNEGFHDYNVLMDFLSNHFLCFENIYEMPHDTPYHTLSISRHTYYVYQYLQNYGKILIWTGLFHDVGKKETKEYIGKYAKYTGHENVSAQETIYYLRLFGYDEDFVIKVATLVQLHMILPWNKNNKIEEKILYKYGAETYMQLQILREADINAK
jgi:predicted kinase